MPAIKTTQEDYLQQLRQYSVIRLKLNLRSMPAGRNGLEGKSKLTNQQKDWIIQETIRLTIIEKQLRLIPRRQ